MDILVNGKQTTVSVSKVKPAYIFKETSPAVRPRAEHEVQTTLQLPAPSPQEVDAKPDPRSAPHGFRTLSLSVSQARQHERGGGRHPGVLPRAAPPGDGRHRLHGQGVGGEAAALLPRAQHHLPADAAQARNRRAHPPRRAAQRHPVRPAAAGAAGRAQQAGAGVRRHHQPAAGPQRHRPEDPRRQRLRRLPLGRHRQVRREAQAVRRHEHRRHQAPRPALPQDGQARGAGARVDRVLQLRPQRGVGDGVRAARGPREDHRVRRVDGRGPAGLHHAQDHRQPAQHVHVHQGAGGAHAGGAERRPARRHRPALHRDGGVAGADSGLGGQPERPHGAAGGRGQGRAAHHPLPPRHGRRPGARRHRHQPAHRRRLVHRHAEAEQHPGVQLHVGQHEPNPVAGRGGDRPREPAEEPVQRRAVVPGRQLQELPAGEQLLRRRLPHAARLPARHRRKALRKEAHHGARAEEAVSRRVLPGVLHDARVALLLRERAPADGKAARRGRRRLRVRRVCRQLAPVLRAVRPGHAPLHPQGGPQHLPHRPQPPQEDVLGASRDAGGVLRGAVACADDALRGGAPTVAHDVRARAAPCTGRARRRAAPVTTRPPSTSRALNFRLSDALCRLPREVAGDRGKSSVRPVRLLIHASRFARTTYCVPERSFASYVVL